MKNIYHRMKHKVGILIIESDPELMRQFSELLQTNPMVLNIDYASDTDQAIFKIMDSNPDIILLEYPTKGKAGKDLIKFIKNKLTETTIIFVSETKDYAADAIHDGIFNYLIKPVSKEVIASIIEKVQQIKQTNNNFRIRQIIEKSQEEKRIRFQTTKGYLIINPEEILYCRADGFCTEIYLTNNRIEMSYLFLSKLEEVLKQFDFLRVSRSYLINQKYIRKVFRSNNTIILSCEGKEYEIKGSKNHIRTLSKFDTE